MRYSLLCTPFVLAAGALALPGPGWNDHQNGRPLTQGDAEDIVYKFTQILAHPSITAANASAQALLAEGFVEKSDSINLLASYPLGTATFSGKQAYINAVLYAPPLTGVQNLKVISAGNLIVWFWRFTGIGSQQLPVQGFNLFELNNQKQIVSSHLEFNSIAWGIDTGYTTTDPAGRPLPLA